MSEHAASVPTDSQPWRLRIEDAADMDEAYGSELYPMSFNDGYAAYEGGARFDKPYWFAYREAKRLGHRWPRDYAHGFCDGYRCCQTNQAEEEAS